MDGLKARALAVSLLVSLLVLTSMRGSPTLEETSDRRPTGPETEMDFPGPSLTDWGWVVGRKAGPSVADVRVTDRGGSVGPGACHVQSEPSVVAYQRFVYVGFNDGRDCLNATGSASYLGYARSDDGGKTFEDYGPMKDEGGISLGGDPSLALDTRGAGAGTLYFASLATSSAGSSTLAVGRSTDNGKTFEWFDALEGVPTGFPDKEWIAVDNSGRRFDGRIYMAWADGATPKLSYSDDRGETWTEPKDLEAGGTGIRPIVGPGGELHLVWATGSGPSTGPTSVFYTRSDGGGETFLPRVTVATAPQIGHLGVCLVPRAVLNGDIRSNGFPSVAVDTFGSSKKGSRDFNPHLGTLYIVFATHGALTDEADVLLATLPRGRGDWSEPVRLNDDETTTDQFLPEIVATGPGRFVATWTDRREDGTIPAPIGNRVMRQYSAEGFDGGDRVDPNVAASDVGYPPPFTNPNGDPLLAPCYMGDYNSMYFDGRRVHAAWGDSRDKLVVEDLPVNAVPDPNVYLRSWAPR